MLHRHWHLPHWKCVCSISWQKEKSNSDTGELPFLRASFKSPGWEVILLVRVIHRQATRSPGKACPASPISSSGSSSERNLWVIETVGYRFREPQTCVHGLGRFRRGAVGILVSIQTNWPAWQASVGEFIECGDRSAHEHTDRKAAQQVSAGNDTRAVNITTWFERSSGMKASMSSSLSSVLMKITTPVR